MKTLVELSSCTGRVILVVGGAGHIGAVAAEVCCELGAHVAVADIDAVRAAEVAQSLGTRFATLNIGGFAVDLADEASTRCLVDDVIKRWGRLDCIVHCAAFVGTTTAPGWAVPFAEQTATAFDAACRVNLTSAFVLAQAAARYLRQARGSMVLVSSMYGQVGVDHRLYEGTAMANPHGYGASKAGLAQLARSLATNLAPDVRINTISPGGVWRGQPASFVRKYEERTPLGRMATEEDLKGAFAFLCSDLSAYVTGHDLVVDGGWTAW